MRELPSIPALIEKSEALERSGDLAQSLRNARRAVEMARGLAEPSVLAAALVCEARVRFRMGQYDKAQALAHDALDLAAADAPARADAWQVLANCMADTHSLAEAEAFYRRAADLSREIGHHRGRAAGLHGLAAAVYLPRGQFDLALGAEEEVYHIISQLEVPELIIYPLITTAMVCQLTGLRERADALLDELGRAVVPGSLAEGYHLCLSANQALDKGDLEPARALYVQARSIAEATGEPWLNSTMRLGMSRYHRLVGDGPNARAWAEDALAYATRVGYRHEQGRALIERGRAAWLCGDWVAAEADLRTASSILGELGAAFDLARARFLLAALLHERGRDEADAAWSEAARSIVGGGYAFLLEQERRLAFPLVAAYVNHPDEALADACATLLEHFQRVPAAPLRVITLGRFEIWQGSRRVEQRSLRRRRAGELFALLVLSPRHSLTFEQVADALWPEKPLAATVTAFHHATSALRRALEPDLPDKFASRYLEVEEGQVVLCLPPGSRVDVEAFEAHCTHGEWEEALALYGGDLLPDYPYADWSITPRQRLNVLFQRGLLALAEDLLAEGRFPEALDACRQLLALEPWHEQAVLVGMRAGVGMGNVAAARRLYRNLETSLREDLNTTPREDLQTLFRSFTPRAKKAGSPEA